MAKIKCIICEKEVTPNTKIEKHDVNFCSEDCLQNYEDKLKKLEKNIDWDNCC
jgi:hypothetical protein